MTPADAVAWLVGMSSAAGIFVSVRAFGLSQRGWLVVQAFVLALVGMRLLWGIEALGYAAGFCWLVLIQGPAFAARRQRDLGTSYRFAEAARWGRIAGWLHPFDGLPAQAAYLLAQGEVHAGNWGRARELFEKLRATRDYRDVAQVELWRLDSDWERIIEFVEDRPELGTTALVTSYLRALGETRQVDRMLRHYARLRPVMRGLPLLRLSVLAFAGQPELVRRLIGVALPQLPASGREYWLAVAHQGRGEQMAAHELLEGLVKRNQLVPQARSRLKAPLAPVDTAALSVGAQRILVETTRELDEARSFPIALSRVKWPVATLSLAILFTAVFLLRYFPGWDDNVGLERAGALVLPVAQLGADTAWRVLAAGALHLDETHLAMNLLGLWVLGKMLESIWGSLAIVGCVVASSVGAYVTALFFMPVSESQRTLLVGASAGIMGLVGALAVFSAIGYFRHDNRLLGKQLSAAGLIVGLQLVFDAFTPMVSSFLHIAGVVWGGVVALPFSWIYFERRKSGSAPPI